MMLIVVSHVNQMVIVNHLVRVHADGGEARVAVLAPPSKLAPLQKQAAETIFAVPYSALVFVRQPEAPLEHSLAKSRELEAGYRELLAATKPDKLVVFARGRHYGILHKLARAAGIEIWYVEEGVSAYSPELRLAAGNRFSLPRLLRQWRAVFRTHWADTWLGETLGYPLRLWRTLRDAGRAEEVQLLGLCASRHRDTLRFAGWRFDRALVSNPERLSEGGIEADRIDRVDTARFRTETAPPRAAPARRCLFLSQPPPTPCRAAVFYRELFFLLADLAYARDAVVVVKPHPREDMGDLLAGLAAADSPRLVLLSAELRGVSAEALLAGPAGADYDALASTGSSALLYAGAVRPGLPLLGLGRALTARLRRAGFPEEAVHPYLGIGLPATDYEPGNEILGG